MRTIGQGIKRTSALENLENNRGEKKGRAETKHKKACGPPGRHSMVLISCFAAKTTRLGGIVAVSCG